MTLYMETTQVADHKTVAAIQDLLAKRGAKSILVDYDAGKVSAVSFRLTVEGNDIPFRLPCRWQAVKSLLVKSGRRPKGKDTWDEWARRVAWRQILRWVEAQLALIETGMVKAEEVFLPYALVGGQGKTMFEAIEEQKFLALPDRTVSDE